MNLSYIKERVDKQIKSYGGYWRPLSMVLRLIEEIGELSKAINIKYGDKRSKNESEDGNVEKELADVLYTAVALSNANNISLNSKTINTNEKKEEIDPLDMLDKLIEYAWYIYAQLKKNYDKKQLTKYLNKIIKECVIIANTLDIALEKSFIKKIGEDEETKLKFYS